LVDEGVHLTLAGGRVYSNAATFGGGLYVMPGAVVTLTGVLSEPDPCPPLLAAESGAPLAAGPLACHGPTVAFDPEELIFSFNSASAFGGGLYNKEGTVRATGVTFGSNRTPPASVTFGGAIANQGMLTLTRSVVGYNVSQNGAGLFLASGAAASAYVEGSAFVSNAASYGGGVFANATTAALTVTDSLFDYNTASVAGGGIWRNYARLWVERSSFTHNQAATGGGLYIGVQNPVNVGLNGVVSIRDTTLSDNTATSMGGGGALYNQDLTSLTNLTISGANSGLNNAADHLLYVKSTVLQNEDLNCSGFDPVDDGYNFASDISCGFTVSQQGVGLDALLGPLIADDYLGTWYRLPQAGSPLINGGGPHCFPRDQRRALRPDACDIGAVERGGMVPALWLPMVSR
jgi:hypothetical protein